MAKEIKFGLFRLNLRQSQQIDMLDAINTERQSRENWIRHVFSQRVEFRHNAVNYVYIPTENNNDSSNVIGKIGREISAIENKSPEEGYIEYVHDAWKAAVVVVDPTEHEDGQKVAIQYHSEVGSPAGLAPRLIQAIERENQPLPFLMGIHPITNNERFWDFAKRNEGKITSIKFVLKVPNMFGSDDEYSQEMKEYREKEKAKTVSMEMKNPEGIEVDTDRVKYTLEKASLGVGHFMAKALGRGNTFSSREQQINSEIPDDENDNLPLIDRAVDLAGKILGRE